MRVLVLGATGFIGAGITAALLAAGHAVVAGVRAPDQVRRRFPSATPMAIDLAADLGEGVWRSRLAGIDAVVNCVGVLQPRRAEIAEAVHVAAPAALWRACETVGVRRAIHVSAIGAEPSAGTLYADTKLRAEADLKERDLDWVILRPGLVWSHDAYGGTALLRALAAMPSVVTMIGRGHQEIAPIHRDDLVAFVVRLVEDESIKRETVEPRGPETMILRDFLARQRDWLGLPPARALPVPITLVRLGCRIGDLLGFEPMTTTALKQALYRITPASDDFLRLPGVAPRSVTAGLAADPSGTADLWHARLYLLRPVVSGSLVFLWLAGAVGEGLAWPVIRPMLVDATGWTSAFWDMMCVAGLSINLMLAAGIMLGVRTFWLVSVQVAMIAVYTKLVGTVLPEAWWAPFCPLVKNVPILALVLVWGAIREERVR